MSDLTGKVALVTGGGAGIGRAIAETLGARGATVAVHYMKSRDGAQATCAAIGGRAAAFQGDLTSGDQVRGVIGQVGAQLGPIDILVNNAGDLIERRSLAEMTEAMFRQVIDVNLTSTFLCCQAIAPSMITRGVGAIINMSSLAAHNGGGPGAFAYAASKAAVIAMTKAIAKELGPKGIRVNCVSPGLIGQTQFHGRFTPPDAFAAAAKTVPLGRAGTPEEVAHVVAFLASDDAAYLTEEHPRISAAEREYIVSGRGHSQANGAVEWKPGWGALLT